MRNCIKQVRKGLAALMAAVLILGSGIITSQAVNAAQGQSFFITVDSADGISLEGISLLEDIMFLEMHTRNGNRDNIVRSVTSDSYYLISQDNSFYIVTHNPEGEESRRYQTETITVTSNNPSVLEAEHFQAGSSKGLTTGVIANVHVRGAGTATITITSTPLPNAKNPIQPTRDTITITITREGQLEGNSLATALANGTQSVVSAGTAGDAHTAAIKNDGSLWTWGNNSHGKLGDGKETTNKENNNRYNHVRIMENVIAVSGGRDHTMAITADGVLWGWGDNLGGKLGDGTTTSRHSPVRIMENVIAVSAGGTNTMAITANGVLWGWGSGSGVGDGTTTSRHSPVRIMHNVIAVSVGSSHTMAITADGVLWGWGRNNGSINRAWVEEYHGQLGDGTTTDRHSPVKIMDNVIAVSAGQGHTMAITTDGVLWGWGANNRGQLGDGTTTSRHSPVRIMDNVVAVSAGGRHTMAITADGELWGWGTNALGGLGIGDDTNGSERHSPVRIMDNVVAVSAGLSYTMAITADGELWGWGHGKSGGVGIIPDATTVHHYRPVRIMSNMMLPTTNTNQPPTPTPSP